MKLLLYCTKAKPYLTRNDLPNEKGEFYKHWQLGGELDKKLLYGDTPILNGKIVAECDFEVEKIKKVNYDCLLFTNTLDTEKLINKSCIGYFKLEKYLKPNWDKEDDLQNLDTVGYAIHIKNLHIFDESKELSEYMSGKFEEWDYRDLYELEKAPQNMQYVSSFYSDEINKWGDTYVLISIRPEWLCKILNGEKTIEVRKKVLKEMLKDE